MKKLLLLCFFFASAAQAVPESFAPLVEELNDSVVNISTTQTIKQKTGIPFGFPSPLFEEFFGQNHPFGGGNNPFEPRVIERQATSLGSGFIYDASGYVVTNNHVIDGADEIEVIMNDNSKYKAKLIGKDPKTDLALLKIESDKPLQAVKFGDSDAAKVGDWVIAIGNPFGLGGSVSAGIISARARNINAGPYDDFIQTDAAINRGNSGGPMFNMKGEVIGINTAIFSTNGGNIGIGFALPSNMASDVLQQLKNKGSVERAWLGVQVQVITPEIAESIGLKSEDGALVAQILPDSPASKADIKVGDVILEFDGKKIEKMNNLPRIVANTPSDKKVEVKLWRDGKIKEITVKTQKAKEDVAGDSQSSGETILGMSLEKVEEGLKVSAVEDNSAAARRGIMAGDIIIGIYNEKVKSPAEMQEKIDAAKKKGRNNVLINLVRGGNMRIFLTVPLN